LIHNTILRNFAYWIINNKNINLKYPIFIIIMSYKQGHHINQDPMKNLNNDIKKSKRDVVDRFLSILWRREVDFKLTSK